MNKKKRKKKKKNKSEIDKNRKPPNEHWGEGGQQNAHWFLESVGYGCRARAWHMFTPTSKTTGWSGKSVKLGGNRLGWHVAYLSNTRMKHSKTVCATNYQAWIVIGMGCYTACKLIGRGSRCGGRKDLCLFKANGGSHSGRPAATTAAEADK